MLHHRLWLGPLSSSARFLNGKVVELLLKYINNVKECVQHWNTKLNYSRSNGTHDKMHTGLPAVDSDDGFEDESKCGCTIKIKRQRRETDSVKDVERQELKDSKKEKHVVYDTICPRLLVMVELYALHTEVRRERGDITQQLLISYTPPFFKCLSCLILLISGGS